MSAFNPQPDDKFIHPFFASGCEVHIIKRGIRKGWGDSVWFEVYPLNRSHINHPKRIRCMGSWPQFAKDLQPFDGVRHD
jgi:hypothetical protein